jgi:hypothetical protein
MEGRAYIHLLDKELSMGKIGLVSENVAEKIADLATKAPYRETAATVSATTGTGISAKGAWDIMQRVVDRIRQEEEQDVAWMKTGKEKSEKVVPVLFEEMDGVWIRQHHCHLPGTGH